MNKPGLIIILSLQKSVFSNNRGKRLDYLDISH
jgi:hypothetical protein